jgi:putative hydrolase of the HAD superfamily
MKYEAVIFDLFGTLVNNIPRSESEKFFTEIGPILKAPGEELYQLWLDIWEKRAGGFFRSTEETFGFVCKKLGISVSYAELEHASRLHGDFIESMVTPRPYAVEVLTRLKSEGYKTGLITDCSAGTVKHWGEIPFSHLIDVPVFSCLERIMKPDSRIYLLAIERLGVEPQKCLYIGDGGGQELTGAAEVGMHPVLIRHPDEDISEMYYEREEWDGPMISSLKEVLNLVK